MYKNYCLVTYLYFMSIHRIMVYLTLFVIIIVMSINTVNTC